MQPKLYRKINVLFYMNSCPHCRTLCEFIERINCKLPIEKQIKMVECTYYQKYGVISDPLLQMYSKKFDGYPTLFAGSIKISGTNSKIESYEFIKGLLEEDFVMPEQSNHKFLKNCELNKSGWLRGKVICN